MKPSLADERTIAFSDMTEGMAAGLWHVPTAGFRWIEDGQPMREILDESEVTDPGPWLMAESNDGRRYPVLRRPRLLEAMDRLAAEPTKENILRFANRWGGLGGEELVAAPIVDPVGGAAGMRGIGSGESLISWRNHLLLYGDLRRLWRAVCVLRQPDSWGTRAVVDADARLQWSITWTSDGSCLYRSRYEAGDAWAEWSDRMIDAVHDRGGAAARRIAIGDRVEAARFYVHRQVNRQMSGHVSPTVLPFLDGVIRLFPDSLAAAVWLRFAFELAGGTGRQRECENCHQPFPLRRRDQRFCGKHCQEAASYRRRANVLRSSRREVRGNEVPA